MPGRRYQIVRVEPWLNTVAVGASGVTGRLSVQLADLDYDKQLELVASKDDWQTTLRLGIGAPSDKNKVYWVEDFPYSGRERWQIDLDLPGGADELRVRGRLPPRRRQRRHARTSSGTTTAAATTASTRRSSSDRDDRDRSARPHPVLRRASRARGLRRVPRRLGCR